MPISAFSAIIQEMCVKWLTTGFANETLGLLHCHSYFVHDLSVEKELGYSFKVQVLAVIHLNTQLKVHVDLVHIIFPQTEFSNTFHKNRSINIPVNSPIKLHIKYIPYKIHSSAT